jgi:pilus assembly protein CpaD
MEMRTTMQTTGTAGAGRRLIAAIAVKAVLAAGCALALAGCNTDHQAVASADPPDDYRLRHPITIKEASRTIELFIGTNRGELTPTQRAQVMSFGLGWKHDATGGVFVDRPVGSSNEQASNDAMREVLSILAASGLPPQSIAVRTYPAGTNAATVRLSYPRMTAQAGPCGLWPKDLGPSVGSGYSENRTWWNFGCASQRNLAAMVDNPADLVQPRGETPAYTMRRTYVVEKYRRGETTSSADSTSAQTAKISDLAK